MKKIFILFLFSVNVYAQDSYYPDKIWEEKSPESLGVNSKKLIHAYGPEKKVLIMPILQTIKRIDKTAKLKVKKISSIEY